MSWPFSSIKGQSDEAQTRALPPNKPHIWERTLQEISDYQLRVWLRKARADGGVYAPRNHYRHYTVAQLTAEKARREGKR